MLQRRRDSDPVTYANLILSLFFLLSITGYYSLAAVVPPSKEFPGHRFSECGTSGTLEERASQCHFSTSGKGERWTLITRSGHLGQLNADVWLVEIQGEKFLWTSPGSKKLKFSEAVRFCQETGKRLPFKESIQWNLPKSEDYTLGEQSGLLELTDNSGLFWTSSQQGLTPGQHLAIEIESIDGELKIKESKSQIELQKQRVQCFGKLSAKEPLV